jgi:hypothetical protein
MTPGLLAHRATLALCLALLVVPATGDGPQLAALVSLAVVGVLALRQCAGTLPAALALRPGVVAGVRRRRATHQAALRLRDPDPPGRARPRAPGSDQAA